MNSVNLEEKFDVIVIGAGLSGLSAAKWLHESGINVLVLEAHDRVGGRMFTKKGSTYKYADFGGSYIDSKQHHLLSLAKELDVETYPINETLDSIYYSDRNGRQRYSKSYQPKLLNPIVYLDRNHFFRTIQQMSQEIPAESPWKAPNAEKWDKMTVREFCEKLLWTTTVKELAEAFCNSVVASGTYESSLLWFLWYLKLCNGVRRIFFSTGGHEERKFVGGAQQICEKISAKLAACLMPNRRAHLSPWIKNSTTHVGLTIMRLGKKHLAHPCTRPTSEQLRIIWGVRGPEHCSQSVIDASLPYKSPWKHR